MAYPREVRLGAEEEEKLKAYLDLELTNHDAERGKWIDDLITWQKEYWAEPPSKSADFPFKGASTIIIPLTAIAVETVHARTMQQLFALPDFTNIRGKAAPWTDLAGHIQNFFDDELLNRIGIRERIEHPILDIEKFGTGIGKSGYEKIVKQAVRTGPDGQEEEFSVVIRDGATVDGVTLNKFLIPFYSKDAQTAPWVGEIHSETPYTVKCHEYSGLFREGTYEALGAWVRGQMGSTDGMNQERKYEREQERNENREAVWPKTVDWVELWMEWDFAFEKTLSDLGYSEKKDRSSYGKEIVVHYHRPSRTICSIRYNWHNDLRRPYRHGVYFPVEYRFPGIGICKISQSFQWEVSTQHRQLLDNATLANCRMIKVNKLSQYGPNEPVFPGKIWYVDNKDDIDTMQLGEVYPSGYGASNQTLTFWNMRSAVNDINTGQSQAGTPGTATDITLRVQEGNKKFDYVYGNIKRFVKDVVLDTLCNIQQFGPRNLSYFQQAEGGQIVQAFLTLPPDLVRDSIVLDVSVAGQKENTMMDRQELTTVWQTLTGYYQLAVQSAMQMGDTQTAVMLYQKGMTAAVKLLQQIMQTYNLRDIEQILPVKELMNGLISPNGAGILGSPPGMGQPGGNGQATPNGNGQRSNQQPARGGRY